MAMANPRGGCRDHRRSQCNDGLSRATPPAPGLARQLQASLRSLHRSLALLRASPPAPSTFAAPVPDPNRPPQGNCPPACTKIPDSAWMAPHTIPLYDKYSWPQLGPLSEAVSSPRFKSDKLCAAAPLAAEEHDSALASRVILPNPPGQWQLQVQILHWRGDPWVGGQRASAVMDSATALLRNNCSFNAPGVSVSRITEQSVPGHPGQSLAAVITMGGAAPLVAYEYLVSDLRNGTVVELAMADLPARRRLADHR
ncbi:ATPase [Mycobacterium sp. 155]|uniref:ATPase n=1 Tax=Mycobacterium sp. 155 TaxID=1157943 RepID=UPI0003A5804C|nr:ATPase [Mycobacterium sp. 155]